MEDPAPRMIRGAGFLGLTGGWGDGIMRVEKGVAKSGSARDMFLA